MSERHQIRCINKSDRYNPHERIRKIGGMNADGTFWTLTQSEAITGIQGGKWEFFVISNGYEVNVIVALSANGNYYLKTANDGHESNNLLSLMECVH